MGSCGGRWFVEEVIHESLAWLLALDNSLIACYDEILTSVHLTMYLFDAGRGGRGGTKFWDGSGEWWRRCRSDS